MAKRVAGPKVYKHHKNDRCFRCRERFETHGHGKDKQGQTCVDFEYVPPSSRKKTGAGNDVLFAAPFQSESSGAIHVVTAWRQGDYSCNCTGWSTHRNCKHCDMVAANPEKYKGKQASAINGGAGSILGTVSELQQKMTAMEAAVKRGDPIELARLQAEVEYQQQMFEAAGAGLGERFAQVQANIHKHVFADMLPEREAQPAPQEKPAPVITQQGHEVVDADNPFGDM